MHSVGQQTSSGLGSGGPGLFGLYNRDKCFLGSARPTSPPSCILISSEPTQGPRNPWPVQASIRHKCIPILLMGVFVLKHKVNLETLFMLGFISDVVAHVLCIAGLPLQRFRMGLWAVCKLTHFTLPECWTGIEKEVVYIEMLNSRRSLPPPPLLFSNHRRDMTHLSGCLLALEEEPKHYSMKSCLQFN